MPRKTFTSGEILTAANVNTFLSNETTLVASTATAYTLGTADRYEVLTFANTAAGTITVGTATAFIEGERTDIVRNGTATLRVTAGSGVTLFGAGTAGTAYAIVDAYSAATVLCTASNTYRIIGNIAAV